MKKFLTASVVMAAAVILVAAQAQATLLVNEPFSYPNGNLAGNTPGTGGGAWTQFSSPGATDIQVVNGQAVIGQANYPDDAIQFGSGFVAGNSDKVYASFDLTLSVLPNGTSYFAMFKDSTTGNFGARVFVTVTNAVAGDYSIGFGNTSVSGMFATKSATLGTDYKIVLRIDNSAGGAGTMWIGPSLETDPSFTPTDTKYVDPWQTFAFRQATAGGLSTVENVDNLMVGTTFNDVIPEPSTVLLVSMGMLGLFAARRRRS